MTAIDTETANAGSVHVRRVLAALFTATFVLGCTEMLVVGLLSRIADDLQVTIPAAGGLVTAYALGVALGGPLLTVATIRWDRRRVLLGGMGAALLAVLAPAVVPAMGYPAFVAVRVLTGASAGLVIAAAFAMGTAIVEPARRGRAISAVFSGIAVSGALGVPLGTLVGQSLGWRGTFVAVALLGGVAVVALALLAPPVPGTAGGTGDQVRHALAPRVLAVLALHVLVFAALYAAMTYIVPFLEGVTGVSGQLVSVFLLVYGVANAAGSLVGGRFADRDAARTLVAGTAGIAVALLVLHLVGAVPVLVAGVLLVLGMVAASMVASLQYRVVDLAGPGGAVAQSLPASAANLGVAAGSLAGGVAIDALSVSAAVLTGVAVGVGAVAVAWATPRLRPAAALS
ncbi:MFS transporter [Pseudonocardia sp. GCM10023141]|uniref:MFS transporter n=1 Tax=Pseudonocardia sp. GCM10023141 TaxID=3252653 RepID=UPI00360AFE92